MQATRELIAVEINMDWVQQLCKYVIQFSGEVRFHGDPNI
jgi:hypothetical protein